MKYSILLLLFIGFTISLTAQEKGKKPIIENTKQEGGIIIFPIKSKTTTDPNYEVNKQKSIDTQKLIDTEPRYLIKDDTYYQEQITEYNRRIKEINEDSNSDTSNPDKLEILKKELELIDKEYTDYKKSK
jgi:hypothetical protein